MEEVRFDWDESKNAVNQKEQGVSFEQARNLFESGADYLELFDEGHSETEERFLAIGPIPGGIVLVVWTEEPEDVVRIIGARWATNRERHLFHTRMEQRHGRDT